MENKYINFVLVCDESYIQQVTVSITSLIVNLSKKYKSRVFVMTYGFDYKPKEFTNLEKKYHCIIQCLSTKNYDYIFKNQDSSTFLNDWISMATYYRLLMFEVLPNDVDFAFYIDSDMVVDTDLSTLVESFDKTKLLGAVAEAQVIKFQEIIFKHLFEIDDFKNWVKDPYKYAYFNAGFYLANIKLCKEKNVMDTILNFLERYPNPKLADQDTLNAVFSQKYNDYMVYFDPSYNIFCNMNYDEIMDKDYFYERNNVIFAMNNPKVYHFGGDKKPWLTRNIFHYYEIWWKYYNISTASLPEPGNPNKFKKFIKKILCRFFPFYTKRGQFMRKVFKKIFKR